MKYPVDICNGFMSKLLLFTFSLTINSGYIKYKIIFYDFQ